MEETRGGRSLPPIPQPASFSDDAPDPWIHVATRFLDKVEFESPLDPNSCWIWNARRNERGYGQFRLMGTIMKAHRVAWMLKYRQHPGKWVVRHTCANKSCVNPDHLRRGKFSQNERDKPHRWKNQYGCGQYPGRNLPNASS